MCFQGVSPRTLITIAAACILSGRVAAHLALPIAAACILSGRRRAPCIINHCRVYSFRACRAHLALPIAAACILSGRRRAPCITNRCRVYPFRVCLQYQLLPRVSFPGGCRAPCITNRCRVYPFRASPRTLHFQSLPRVSLQGVSPRTLHFQLPRVSLPLYPFGRVAAHLALPIAAA